MMHTTCYRGDRARYTGKTEELYGAIFAEVVLLEGHLKGEKRLIKLPPIGADHFSAISTGNQG